MDETQIVKTKQRAVAKTKIIPLERVLEENPGFKPDWRSIKAVVRGEEHVVGFRNSERFEE